MSERNVIKFKILENGTVVQVCEGGIDADRHFHADKIDTECMERLGGEVKTTHLPHAHKDTGEHTHYGEGVQH